MGKEVICRVLAPIIGAIQIKAISPDIWLKDIPYPLEYLLDKHERIEWSVYCQLMKNIRPFFTDEEIENIGSVWAKSPLYRPWAMLMKLLFNLGKSLPWAQDMLQKMGTQYFSSIEFHLEEFGQNGFKVILNVRDGYEFCPEHFLLVKGAMRYVPKLIGYFKVNVTMRWIDRGAEFENSYKKGSMVSHWLAKKINRFLIEKGTLHELYEAHQALLVRYHELENARYTQEQQTIQLKTVHEISQVIRQSLNLDRTLRAIVKAMVEIAGFSTSVLELFADAEGNAFKRKVRYGKFPEKTEALLMPIILAESEVGFLKVWPNPNQNISDCQNFLNRVSPTINMAVHDTLIYKTVLDYRNHLEQKVEDRTIELTRTRDELTKIVDLLKKAQSSRDHFFANISHEFRTPLTLILGPIEQMLSGAFRGNRNEQFQLIRRNAQRLLRLINQLLDLSRLESGGMTLQAREENIVELVRGFVQSFESLARRKNITLKFEAEQENIPLFVDCDKIEKILNNLLANAFKFTAEGGSVNVECGMRNAEYVNSQFRIPRMVNGPGKGEALFTKKSPDADGFVNNASPLRPIHPRTGHYVEITVSDTGVGIPADRLDKIFDRFYQVDDSQKKSYEGTGIGLALTKELVELHHGYISVESELGKGTTFRIYLPLGKAHLKECEINLEQPEAVSPETESVPRDSAAPVKASKRRQTIPAKSAPLLLIVDDNADLRRYMCSALSPIYRLLEAADGQEGFDAALGHIPDLIISDVMMPKMDGYELCRQLKTDERVSHIPVILLTARAESKDKIEGLETGADDYVMKPFVAEELLARIKNLIGQRRKLRERFSQEAGLLFSGMAPTSADNSFVGRIMEISLKHLSETKFNLEALAEEIGMSRMTLHRKIEGLFGQSPGAFVRTLRLKRGAELLKAKDKNISEIAYEVGFESPANFSAAFRRQFGMSPSKYCKQLQKN